MTDWYWDDNVKRYRDSHGRFLSRSVVLSYIEQSIRASQNVSLTLAEMVYNGILSVSDWEDIMREQIKREYIRSYLLGHGGVNTMTAADWGRIGGMLAEQYKYLKNFASQIATGNLSFVEIQSRSGMYFSSAREAYERATGIQAEEWGAVSESWHTMPGSNSCADCIAFEREGVKPFGYFPYPGSGKTACLTNCNCTKLYYDANGNEYYV